MRHLAVALLVLVALPASADPYNPGSALPELSLPDQHGSERRIDASVHVVLFARDMGGGDVLKKALEADGAALLRDAGAVYVTDMSGMPGPIRRFFALPGLRRRPYPILVDQKGDLTRDFPSRPDHATFLDLTALEVNRIRFFTSPERLRQALQPEDPSPDPETER